MRDTPLEIAGGRTGTLETIRHYPLTPDKCTRSDPATLLPVRTLGPAWLLRETAARMYSTALTVHADHKCKASKCLFRITRKNKILLTYPVKSHTALKTSEL